MHTRRLPIAMQRKAMVVKKSAGSLEGSPHLEQHLWEGRF